ncbi:MAG: sigma-54 dependent transcriptional regulator [Pyrinomonadaceae bacterium]
MQELVANSEKMRIVLRLAQRVAPTDSTVLITGESGTGKNTLCKFIHSKSKRAGRDLVNIDCAALPKELIEAELFGFERGAFTGATESKTGRLEAAHKSTLLLDEIALVPFESQAKLLRVLEEREFERLGGRKIFKIDVRVIATTNVELEAAIERKTFREDLFFRLNVMRIELPPLRERQADIPDLCDYFLRFFSAKHGLKDIILEKNALDMLQKYNFPGNIRELSNLLERAVLTADNNKVTVGNFPQLLPNTGSEKKCLTLAELEARHVRETLILTRGNKTEAAKLLGISRKNLYERIARHENQ